MKEKFQITRNQSVDICRPLELEDYVPQPSEFVSPPKWHLAHTTWFFEEFVLKKFKTDYREFHHMFGYMFNSYYNTIGARVKRAERGFMTRPTVEQVMNYRNYVDHELLDLLQTNHDPELTALVEIGINHEEQHQELLLSDIKYILGSNPMFPPYEELNFPENATNEENGFVRLEAGLYEIGATSKGFSYDNEHGRHSVHLDAFCISKDLVTNGEYLDFILDGGYDRHELWLDEGWSWVNAEQISAPMYWHLIDGSWMLYSLGGLIEIDRNALLCHVSHYEAAAFAEWKKMRLPTEFEWEAASDQIKWGQRWEHTGSAYLPYPGFRKPEGAVGEYNGKFMMNQMVLRGASIATTKGHARRTYRNFFHPNMQWQFSGIRLAKDE